MTPHRALAQPKPTISRSLNLFEQLEDQAERFVVESGLSSDDLALERFCGSTLSGTGS